MRLPALTRQRPTSCASGPAQSPTAAAAASPAAAGYRATRWCLPRHPASASSPLRRLPPPQSRQSAGTRCQSLPPPQQAGAAAEHEQQQERLEGAYMEEIYVALTQRALQRLQQLPEGGRLLIGVAGAPGSGKSTLAKKVQRRLAAVLGPDAVAVVPMDGFHLYRSQLDAMPDPQAAHARRGAPWTFDAEAYVACIRSIRDAGQTTILAPSFGHGVGDPVPDDIAVTPSHRVVLSEGNYLLVGEQPWAALRQLFDDTWFVDCDLDAAMERVYARQVGHGRVPEVVRGRITTNDRPNAELVAASRPAAALVVPSLPFKGNAEA